MTRTQKWPLELLALLPIALRDAPPDPGDQKKLQIHSQRIGSQFCLRAEGYLSAERILERLGPKVRNGNGYRRLHLDLSRAEGVDNLALSALLVTLRNNCRHSSSILVKGLESWAVWRLACTGAQNILGRQWEASFGPTHVQFERQEQDRPYLVAPSRPQKEGVTCWSQTG